MFALSITAIFEIIRRTFFQTAKLSKKLDDVMKLGTVVECQTHNPRV
jgi:hypothetical protein